LTQLPIDPLLPDIVASLRHSPCLVLRAPPGAGKTTRVPPALLDGGLAGDGQLLVLEPRRLAARLSARRVASERGEAPGQTIGYQVRFEDVSSAQTRIRFVTEGILTRRLASDPQLRGVNVVVLDEFHERHVHTDMAISLLRRLQQSSRPELRIVVMSATIDTGPVAAFLGGCPVLQAEGRRFEVQVSWQDQPDDRPLELQVASAVRGLVRGGLDGDVLVFLPGGAEIRKAGKALEPLARESELLVTQLHGDLPLTEQDRALSPADRRKVVLSTNVAETSITVEGVVAVIDSGLARVAGHAAWSGLPTLAVRKISKGSAEQRAGRAGRTRAGRCIRLYTRQDFAARPAFEVPELQRSDLAEPLLVLHALGVREPRAFGWFEAPPEPAVEAAENLLAALGAVQPDGSLGADGRDMVRLPVHPRVARLLLEALRRRVLPEATLLAAILGERSLAGGRGFGTGATARRTGDGTPSRSDLLDSLELFEEAQARRFDHEMLRYAGIDAGAARAVDRVSRQLHQLASRLPPRKDMRPTGDTDREAALLPCVLAAFPDRVARRVRGRELALAAGGAAELAESSAVQQAEFLVAVDAEERQLGRGRKVLVREASAIEPDWLLELFPQVVRSSRACEWNAAKKRVEAIERLQYGALVLDETRTTTATGDDVTQVLADEACKAGPSAFCKPDELERLLARVKLLAQHVPEAGLPALGMQDALQALRALCEGKRSFEQLQQVGLLPALEQRLTPAQRAALSSMAPERVTLAAGRTVKVHYEADKDPWIESRLQDFFGMQQGPCIAQGRVPLVLHLLAPNRRAVQVTRDLAGFWERHYPAIRRELSRRYPKHDWRT
jgi:ATP-dependent helicase HrpB